MKLPRMEKTRVDGVILETIDKGSGEPVVFIHGAMGDECFAVLEEPALTATHRLIHYHRRGWGEDGCPEAPVSFDQQSIKIIRRGELQEDLLRVVLHNCRLPTWNFSDFNAIVAALRTAAIRCVEISRRFGDDVFYSAMDAMLERNKRAMRELIRRTVPEKRQYFEDYVCDDGMNMGPYKIACSMWREGDKCIFDFTGTDPQSISSINFLLNEEMFKMFAGVYMIMVFDPQILFNDGFYDLMDVRIPPGTLLKPLKPAALSCRTHALGRLPRRHRLPRGCS